MYMGGRFVSLETLTTLFIFWALGVAVLGVALWRLSRRRPPTSTEKKPTTRRHRGKRHQR